MPDSSLEQFSQDLHREVLRRAGDKAAPQFLEDAFTEHVLELLSEHNEADGADVVPSIRWESRGSMPAAKLNAWGLSGDGATLDLFVSLYCGADELQDVGLPDTRRHFKLASGFLRRASQGFHSIIEESNPAYQAARQIHKAKDFLTTVRLFFLTDGAVRSLEVEEEPFGELEVRYVVWDLDKLSRLRVGHREVIELDFVNDYGGAIPCLQTADATGEYRTYLAYFPAPLLARIYGEHGQRLLERNVRAFLQAKGKVNRDLQKTLKEEPHRFLAYNNGLCCTAAEVKVQAGQDSHARLESVKDFQIVNGGQTTASIYHAVKKERVSVDQVVVQVKLTVLKDPAQVTEIVPLISRYANSQNKVNAADFSANGPLHHKLEQLSRNVWAPPAGGLERGTHWHYERARGSYADDRARQGTVARRRDWEVQNPPHQKFTKTDLAKFEHAWVGLPHLVCLGAEKNFMKFAERMEDDGEPVVDENYFKQTVAKAILFRTAEKLFSVQELEGYRANSVAYAVAWMAARSGRRIDLSRIWQEQRLSPTLCDALKIVCKAAHEHIIGQEGNPGEASKKDECWEAFRNKDIDIGEAWRKELSDTAFIVINTEDDALAQEWERVRHQFINDRRSIGELEALNWISARRHEPIYSYAECGWDKLRSKQGLGLKKSRVLVEILSAAARLNGAAAQSDSQ